MKFSKKQAMTCPVCGCVLYSGICIACPKGQRMTTYKIVAHERHFTYTEPDDEEWGSTGEYGVSVTLLSLHRSDPRHARMGWVESAEWVPSDEIPIGETAWVVWPTWSDGDTFGSSEEWRVITVKESFDSALEVRAHYEDNDSIRLPWNGYFASLNWITITPMLVHP